MFFNHDTESITMDDWFGHTACAYRGLAHAGGNIIITANTTVTVCGIAHGTGTFTCRHTHGIRPHLSSSSLDAGLQEIAEAIQTEMASPPLPPSSPASVTRSTTSTPFSGVSYTPCPPGTKCGHIHIKTRHCQENKEWEQEREESSFASTPDSVIASTGLEDASTPLSDKANHTRLPAGTDGRHFHYTQATPRGRTETEQEPRNTDRPSLLARCPSVSSGSSGSSSSSTSSMSPSTSCSPTASISSTTFTSLLGAILLPTDPPPPSSRNTIYSRCSSRSDLGQAYIKGEKVLNTPKSESNLRHVHLAGNQILNLSTGGRTGTGTPRKPAPEGKAAEIKTPEEKTKSRFSGEPKLKESGRSGWWVAWIPWLEAWAEGVDPAVAGAMALEGGQGDTYLSTWADEIANTGAQAGSRSNRRYWTSDTPSTNHAPLASPTPRASEPQQPACSHRSGWEAPAVNGPDGVDTLYGEQLAPGHGLSLGQSAPRRHGRWISLQVMQTSESTET